MFGTCNTPWLAKTSIQEQTLNAISWVEMIAKWSRTSRSMTPIFNTSWEIPKMHILCNLVIPVQVCDELSCRQGKVYRRMDAQMDRHRQWLYPFGLKGQAVKINSVFQCQNLTLICSGHGYYQCFNICVWIYWSICSIYTAVNIHKQYNSLKNKCGTKDPDRQNLGRSGKLSFFNIYKFWQNCASVWQVSDLILKTDRRCSQCSNLSPKSCHSSSDLRTSWNMKW